MVALTLKKFYRKRSRNNIYYFPSEVKIFFSMMFLIDVIISFPNRFIIKKNDL